MLSKRKNDGFPLSTYDQALLFSLYRWLRWEKTQTMIVDASPETCLAHIQPDLNRKHYNLKYMGAVDRPQRYHYRVKPQADRYPYRLKVILSQWVWGRSYQLATIFIVIMQDEIDDQKSIITLHAYPIVQFLGSVFLIMVLLLVAMMHAAIAAPLQALIFVLIIPLTGVVTWKEMFAHRSEGLDVLTDHFISLSRSSESKRNPDIDDFIEEEYYDRQSKAQK